MTAWLAEHGHVIGGLFIIACAVVPALLCAAIHETRPQRDGA